MNVTCQKAGRTTQEHGHALAAVNVLELLSTPYRSHVSLASC